jgi:hypothetical protein
MTLLYSKINGTCEARRGKARRLTRSIFLVDTTVAFHVYNASKEAINSTHIFNMLRIFKTNINKIYMNHSQGHRDYPDTDYDSSIATAHAFLRNAAAETILTNITQLSRDLRFFATPVSSAASLPSVSSDGTKLSLERSTSKMTSGSEATRASA